MPDAPAPDREPIPNQPQGSRSSRRLTPLRRLLYRIATPVGAGLIRLWWRTCRVVRVVGEESALAAIADGPVVPVFWHQHMLFCVHYVLGLRDRGLRPSFLISPSVDGEIPAAIARRAGAHVVRGSSSSSSGARVVRDNFMALRQGISPVITPDGPYGPRYEFKPGAILAAQLSGRPLLPLAFHASRAWRFRNWDHFVLPWPFARVVVAVGAPRWVPKTLDAAAVARWQAEMAAELKRVYGVARAALPDG